MDALRAAIEKAVTAAAGEAYEIGYAHGGNPYRHGRGEPPQRVDDGWDRPVTTATLAAMQAVRDLRVVPALLRWCDWPGCWRSYDATIGPVGEPGWRMLRRPHVLLCPTHDQAGHRPSFDPWTQGDQYLTGRCECNAFAEVRPANHQAVIGWWTGHVATTPPPAEFPEDPEDCEHGRWNPDNGQCLDCGHISSEVK
jgi:hypothetical protein